MPLTPQLENVRAAMLTAYGQVKGEQAYKTWATKHGIKPEKETYSIESKSLTFDIDNIRYSEVKAKGESRYYVTGYISTSDLDYVNDIVTKECLDDMVEQIKSGNIKLDVEHEAYKESTTKVPIGKIIDARRDDKGIWVKAEINKNAASFKEVWGSIKDKFLDAFSITFKPVEAVKKEVDGILTRFLQKVTLLNVALTGNPCNEHATISQVFTKSILTEKKMEDEKPKVEEEAVVEPTDSTPQPEEPVDGAEVKTEEIEVVEKKSMEELRADINSSREEIKSLREELEAKDKLAGEVKELQEQLAELKKKPVFKAQVEEVKPQPKAEGKGVLQYTI